MIRQSKERSVRGEMEESRNQKRWSASKKAGLVLRLLLVCAPLGHGPVSADPVIQSVGGMPAVVIDGQPQAPLMFFGNTQFGTDEVAWAEIAKAAQAGFHLHMIALTDLAQLDEVVAADPQARFLVQTSVFPSWDWLAAHPDDQFRYADGSVETSIPLASVSSRQWRVDYGEQLRNLVRNILSHSNGDRVVGMLIGYMTSGEWFYWGTNERKYSDYSPVNVAAFRAWLAHKYSTDAALQAAWHEPSVTLPTAQIPTPAERDATHAFDLRDPSTSDQKTIDYYRFMADEIIDAQEHFREIVREETAGRWLTLHYFGYGYELSDYPFRANYGGHMAYARRSFGSPTLDMAAGPYSYYWRGPGQPGTSHTTQHSWALYNQLYWHEDDTRPTELPTLIQLARRNAARQLIYGGGLWWMDMLTQGWWDYQQFWDAVAPLRVAYEDYLGGGDRSLDPEFVIIADPDVFAYLNDDTGPSADAMALQRLWFESLGARIGYFTAQDLRQPAFPQEHAKLYYFINPYAVDDSYLSWIVANLKRDGNVLVWLYAPGLVTQSGLSDAHMAAVTGLSLHHSTTPLSLRIVITNGSSLATQGLAGLEFGTDEAHSPVVYADPGQDGVIALGVYKYDTSKIAYCMKDFGTWKSVFLGTPGILYVPVLRGLANLAGVHLYPPASLWPSYDDGIAASKDFLALHAAGDGIRTLVFPETQAEIRDVFTGQVLATNTDTVSLPVSFANTYLLRLSPRLAAEVLSFTAPQEVQAGQPFTAALTFANRGRDTWSGTGGYAVVSQAPVGNSTWGPVVVPLGIDEAVAPGASYTFALNLTGPAKAGIYRCRWRMSEVGGRGGFGVAAQATVKVHTFSDVTSSYWAWAQVEACVGAGIVNGYPDGTYHPTDPVTRDQMAVYISRALAGGDANVPTGPATARFSDVATSHWAFKYIEYAVSQRIVTGYSDGTYHPEYPVDRGQMAVFMARAIAPLSERPDLASYTPTQVSFPDVPATFWSYKFVEYIKQNQVTSGYPDGYYHPEYPVTRDQLAVYVARALGLL